MIRSVPVQHVGRVFLALLFIVAGVTKITGFEGTTQYFTHLGFPVPVVATVLAIIVECGAGLVLLLGMRFDREAALLLAVFTLIASVMAHQFWINMAEMTSFLKNLALIGALLMYWNAGVAVKKK